LEGLQPQYLLDRITYNLKMPPAHSPSKDLTHGERCLKVMYWADSPNGPGLAAIDEQLRLL
jgi:hypothetical protein